MEQAFGRIESIKGDIAVVLIQRGRMCGENCSSCGMCGGAKTKITAKNTIGANVGDSVVLSVPTSKGLKATLLVYGVPVCILILSAILFQNVGFSESISVLFGFLLMVVWFLAVFFLEKTGKFEKDILASIVKKRG